MDNPNLRKETALKELKRKIAEVESEIRTQVDISEELRQNIYKEKEEPRKSIKGLTNDMEEAETKAKSLRRTRDTLVSALRIMEEA